MEKLRLTCTCGQDLLVPANALNKKGLCPSCGARIRITKENTRSQPSKPRPARSGGLMARLRKAEPTAVPREEAWRRFAEAVDLYNDRRYAEALTILDDLLRKFPGNPHIEAARTQCLEALDQVVNSGNTYAGDPVDETSLNAALVQRVVLEKLLNGSTEAVQLQAADMAARILGLYSGSESRHDAPAGPPRNGSNAKPPSSANLPAVPGANIIDPDRSEGP